MGMVLGSVLVILVWHMFWNVSSRFVGERNRLEWFQAAHVNGVLQACLAEPSGVCTKHKLLPLALHVQLHVTYVCQYERLMRKIEQRLRCCNP